MKKLLPLTVLMFFVTLLTAQVWVQYWGKDGNTKIRFGSHFITRYDTLATYTDSVNLAPYFFASYLLEAGAMDTIPDDAQNNHIGVHEILIRIIHKEHGTLLNGSALDAKSTVAVGGSKKGG